MSNSQNSDDVSIDAAQNKRRSSGFHSSTVILATWIVLIPWLLISVPGKHVGILAPDGILNSCFEHGWPFVSFERLTYESKLKMNTRSSQIGLTRDQVKRLAERMQELRIDTANDGLEFDLKTGQPEVSNIWLTGNNARDFSQTGFWTNTRRWPLTGGADEEVLQLRWSGVILNLGTLAVLWLIVAWLIEKRFRRRGSHLRFSMFEFLIVVSMLAALLALLRNEYNRSVEENEVVADTIESFRSDLQVAGQRKISLPASVSQLFDHRSRMPFTEVHLFRPVEKLYVNISSQKAMAKDRQKRDQFVKALDQSPFPVHLSMEVHLITPDIMQQLTASEAIIEAQVFHVLHCDWNIFLETGGDIPEFKFGFPNVKRLGVGLSRNVPQKNQIQPFLKLPNLEDLHIYDVDVDGADYLVSVRDQLPKQTTADLRIGLKRSMFPEFAAAFADPADKAGK